MKLNFRTRRIIGLIGVDAGLCWIGDPCYILHKCPPPKAVGTDWDSFCDLLDEDGGFTTHKQFNYDLGHSGLGVVVSTGNGDGAYPVFAEFTREGRVARVCVEFIPDEFNN